MSFKQWLAIGATLGLLLLLWFFGKTKQDEKQGKTGEEKPKTESAVEDFKPLIEAEIAILPEEEQRKIDSLIKISETGQGDSSDRNVTYQIVAIADSFRLPVISAIYHERTGMATNDAKEFEEAADNYAVAALLHRNETENVTRLTRKAIALYEKAISLAPTESLKVKLAQQYMDGTGEVMKGVQILLEVVEQNPDNIEANITLARYGLISGQTDKAIERLEHVLQLDSLNAEAYYYLGEAYATKGQIDLAILHLQKCKELVDDPAFSKEIDNYIIKIKAARGS